MKISFFSMTVVPSRFPYGFGHTELKFRIEEFGGNVKESIIALLPDVLPDDQSMLDYIFDRAKKELKDHIVGTEMTKTEQKGGI